MNLFATASPSVDIPAIIDIVKGVMTLFTEFPLNIMLGAGIATIGFKVFKKGKSSVNP